MSHTLITRRALLAMLALSAAVPQAARAQGQDPSRLSVERIFASPEFRLQSLPAVQWMNDGQRFTFVGDDGDLVVEEAATGTRSVIVDAALLVPARPSTSRTTGGPTTSASCWCTPTASRSGAPTPRARSTCGTSPRGG
jgi:hypothetical protein